MPSYEYRCGFRKWKDLPKEDITRKRTKLVINDEGEQEVVEDTIDLAKVTNSYRGKCAVKDIVKYVPGKGLVVTGMYGKDTGFYADVSDVPEFEHELKDMKDKAEAKARSVLGKDVDLETVSTEEITKIIQDKSASKVKAAADGEDAKISKLATALATAIKEAK